MSKEYVVIKSARSYRRYRAKGYHLQAWRTSPWLSAPRQGMLRGEEEQQLVRDLLAKKQEDWEVRAYPPADLPEDERQFNFFWSDGSPGLNPKTLAQAHGLVLYSLHVRKQSLSDLKVGEKYVDHDGDYIVRIK